MQADYRAGRASGNGAGGGIDRDQSDRRRIHIDTVAPPYRYSGDCPWNAFQLERGGAGPRCDPPNPRRENLQPKMRLALVVGFELGELLGNHLIRAE